MQMVELCGSSMPAWKRNRQVRSVFIWLIVQILINLSQVLASYLVYYLTCMCVVYETQYVENLGQYGMNKDFL